MESYNAWTDYEVSFEGNTLVQGYVAIRAGVTAEDNYSVYLDNVKIDTAAYVPPAIDTTSTDTTAIVLAQAITLVLQPNPATAEVRVCTVGPAEISLVDMQGRTVGRWRTDDGEATLPVGTLPRGAYFVRTVTQQGTATAKLLLL